MTREKIFKSIYQLSERTGLSRAGLYRAMEGTGNPTAEVIARILGACGRTWRDLD